MLTQPTQKETHQKHLSWVDVENHLDREVYWRRNTLRFYNSTPKKELQNVQTHYGYCKNCILRKIAILISSGEVEAREIQKSPTLSSFWLPYDKENGHARSIYHGSKWHSSTMEIIENHFRTQHCRVTREPRTPWGRADLGVYKEGYKNLYVEAGTTSAFKLFVNLKKSKDAIYLNVPDDEKVIEFTV